MRIVIVVVLLVVVQVHSDDHDCTGGPTAEDLDSFGPVGHSVEDLDSFGPVLDRLEGASAGWKTWKECRPNCPTKGCHCHHLHSNGNDHGHDVHLWRCGEQIKDKEQS